MELGLSDCLTISFMIFLGTSMFVRSYIVHSENKEITVSPSDYFSVLVSGSPGAIKKIEIWAYYFAELLSFYKY